MFNTSRTNAATKQVHTTSDYSLFKPIDGNRTKNILHIKRLKEAMQKNYLFTVLVVNENYEIIDGQHRFEVIKELELPLNYIVCNGYGLNEVHILNANSKTWNADDYMNGYCELGYPDYIKYRDFKDKYKMPHNVCKAILSGISSNARGEAIKQFYNGTFKVNNYFFAVGVAEHIKSLSAYYDGATQANFIFAILQLLKNVKFNVSELTAKMKAYPTMMKNCATKEQYIALIEEIYNYRRRDKVNLRY